jgi:hypothetical protein
MPIPTTYVMPGTGTIASYNWEDLAEGTGIVSLYGYTTSSGAVALVSGAMSFKIGNTSSIYSNNIETSGIMDIEEEYYRKFDMSPFNLPKIINGTGTIIVTIGGYASTGLQAMYPKVTLHKVSGGTESTIVSTSGAITSGAVNLKKTYALSMTIPRTAFKKNDTLRLKVGTVQCNPDVGAQCTHYIAHDPADRDGNYLNADVSTTKLVFHCPFETGE